jgi:hypothetical protein
VGSFNTICFASRQTISPGDGCLVMPVMGRTDYSPLTLSREGREDRVFPMSGYRCYPDSFWTPLWGFFEAVYDDYGRVSLMDSVQARRRLVAYFAHMVEKEVANEGESLSGFLEEDAPALSALIAALNAPATFENRTEEVASVFDYSRRLPKSALKGKSLWAEITGTWEYLWDQAMENQLYIERATARWSLGAKGMPEAQRISVFAPVQFSIVHRAAADYMIGWLEKQKGPSGSFRQREVVARGLAASNTLAMLREEAGRRKKGKLRPEAEIDAVASGYLLAWLEFGPFIEGFANFEGIHYNEEDGLRPLFAAYADKVITEDEFFEVVQPMLDTRYIMAGLESMNLRIEPVVTTGQDYENELGRSFAKFIRNTSAAVSRQRKALRD